MDTKTERELMDEILAKSVSHSTEVKGRYLKGADEVYAWASQLCESLWDKTYDSFTYFGYLYHILSMFGGEFTIPAKVRIENHETRRKSQILQTENPDGSCTIRLNYLEE